MSVFALQALVVLLPSLGTMLDVVPLGVRHWGIVLVLAAVPAVVGQIIKWTRARRVGGTPTVSE